MVSEKKDKGYGIKFICYYNYLLCSVFIIGVLGFILFSTMGGKVDFSFINYRFIFYLILALFSFFSAKKFMNHSNFGRVSLIVCSTVQVLTSLKDIINTFYVARTLHPINFFTLIVGLWAVWFLNSHTAKEWLNIKT